MYNLNNKCKYMLLYSHEYDPITKILLNNKKFFPKNKFIFLHVKDLLKSSTEIFDEIVENKTKINWILRKIKINNQTVVINRIHHLELKWFYDFAADYVEYAFAEFSAYLVFALNSFEKLYEKPGGSHCLLGNNMPLPLLWKKVACLGVNVPSFFWGSIKCLPLSWNENQVILKDSPYEYYFWRANFVQRSEKDFAHTSCFAILKPEGIPLLITQIGELITVKCADHECAVNINEESYSYMINKLKDIAIMIHKQNQHWCSESLFFVDFSNKKIIFAMINNYMYASYSNDSDFQDNLLTTVKKIIV